jgi:hypothetical protein
MTKEYRVNVYADREQTEIVGRVRYNQSLDYWDGRNFTNGSVGRHWGLTKLKDGRYVLIHGTQWQGEKDYAEVISAEEALRLIMKTQNTDLLKTKKYKDLAEMYKAYENEEDDEA